MTKPTANSPSAAGEPVAWSRRVEAVLVRYRLASNLLAHTVLFFISLLLAYLMVALLKPEWFG